MLFLGDSILYETFWSCGSWKSFCLLSCYLPCCTHANTIPVFVCISPIELWGHQHSTVNQAKLKGPKILWMASWLLIIASVYGVIFFSGVTTDNLFLSRKYFPLSFIKALYLSAKYQLSKKLNMCVHGYGCFKVNGKWKKYKRCYVKIMGRWFGINIQYTYM